MLGTRFCSTDVASSGASGFGLHSQSEEPTSRRAPSHAENGHRTRYQARCRFLAIHQGHPAHIAATGRGVHLRAAAAHLSLNRGR
jgi:hypothetical protein